MTSENGASPVTTHHPLRAIDFYDGFEFFAITRSEVRKGDLFANHATITAVVKGPRKNKDPFDNVAADEVLFRCGKDFASKGKADAPIIVGRRRG